MLPFSKKIRKFWIFIIIFGYAALILLWRQIPDQRFRAYFLDVGQGDGILIKTPENHQILIDGGPENFVLGELIEVMPFFDKSIDLVVLTHPHADHISGLIEVLKRYHVDNVLITGVDYKSPEYTEFLNEISEQNVQVFWAEEETDFIFGEVLVDVIYPENPLNFDKFENINNSSIAMMIKFRDKKILLTGDLELEGETELIRTGTNLKADIFKAGHHGSRTSSSLNLLKLVEPKAVIIQSGKGNSYKHPHEETLKKLQKLGIKVYRNDEMGRVEFIF